MDAKNDISFDKTGLKNQTNNIPKFTPEDKLAFGHIKYAQGLGASLRQANELRAVQKTGRLPFLKSSNLHEDVLRGKLGPGNGFSDIFGDQEETGMSRLAYL